MRFVINFLVKFRIEKYIQGISGKLPEIRTLIKVLSSFETSLKKYAEENLDEEDPDEE